MPFEPITQLSWINASTKKISDQYGLALRFGITVNFCNSRAKIKFTVLNFNSVFGKYPEEFSWFYCLGTRGNLRVYSTNITLDDEFVTIYIDGRQCLNKEVIELWIVNDGHTELVCQSDIKYSSTVACCVEDGNSSSSYSTSSASSGDSESTSSESDSNVSTSSSSMSTNSSASTSSSNSSSSSTSYKEQWSSSSSSSKSSSSSSSKSSSSSSSSSSEEYSSSSSSDSSTSSSGGYSSESSQQSYAAAYYVGGTSFPGVTGTYNENGTYNGKPAYERADTAYWLWWDNGDHEGTGWTVSSVKGGDAGFWYLGTSEKIKGNLLLAGGTGSGWAEVFDSP